MNGPGGSGRGRTRSRSQSPGGSEDGSSGHGSTEALNVPLKKFRWLSRGMRGVIKTWVLEWRRGVACVCILLSLSREESTSFGT